MAELYPEVRVKLLYQRDTWPSWPSTDWPATAPDRAAWPVPPDRHRR